MKRSLASFTRISVARFPLKCQPQRVFATHGSGLPLHPDSSHSAPPLPFSRYISPDRHVGIVGAPFSGGQPLLGVDLGPRYIRKGGLIQRLEKDSWRVHDNGDINIPNTIKEEEENDKNSNVKRAVTVGSVNRSLYDSAQTVLQSNHFLLTLGGDHSIGIGSIAAVLKHRPDVGIVWIDAHADINTPSTSSSGNPHGMVLAFLMNLESSRDVNGFDWMDKLEIPKLDPQRLVYIGLRDLDEGEKLIIKKLNIKSFTMHDVDKVGIGQVMTRAIDHLTHFAPRPIHLSLDIDSIDPLYAPSTGTRVAGGLSYREAYYVCESLAETGMLTSMDMVEVNPSINEKGEELLKEDSERTIQMAIGLIASAMGNKIL